MKKKQLLSTHQIQISKIPQELKRFLTKNKFLDNDINGMQQGILDSKKPIHFAIEQGNLRILLKLLECGANVDATFENETALHLAAKLGKFDMVDLLVKNGANVNFKDNNGEIPWHIAAKYGHRHIANYLIYSMPRPISEEEKLAMLLWEILNKFNEPVKALLGNRDINDITLDNEPYLHYAVLKGSEEKLIFFLKKGANPNKLNSKGFSALHYAVQFCRENRLTTILLQNTADINLPGPEDNTALHLACSNENSTPETVDTLLRYGANVNAKNKSGFTPLNLACKHIKTSSTIAYMLIHAGTIDLKDALASAIKSENIEAIKVLLLFEENLSEFTSENIAIQTILSPYKTLQEHIKKSDWNSARFLLSNVSPSKPSRISLLDTELAANILELERIEISKKILEIGESFNPNNISFERESLCIDFNTAIQTQSFLKLMLLLSNSTSIRQENSTIKLQYPFSLETTCYLERKSVLDNRLAELKNALTASDCKITYLTQNNSGEDGKIILFFTIGRETMAKLTKEIINGVSFSLKKVKDGIELTTSTSALQDKREEIFESIITNIKEKLIADIKKQTEEQDYKAQRELLMQKLTAEKEKEEVEKKLIERQAKEQAEREKELKERKSRKKILPDLTDTSNTPLHEAVLKKNLELVMKLSPLVELYINSQNKDGDTPLHLAARQCSPGIFNFLLNRPNCNPSLENNLFQTALQIAEENTVTIDLPAHLQPRFYLENKEVLFDTSNSIPDSDKKSTRENRSCSHALIIDSREPTTAYKVILPTATSDTSQPSRNRKRKQRSSFKPFEIKGENELRNIRDRISSLTQKRLGENYSESFYHYALTLYVISGLIQIDFIIKNAFSQNGYYKCFKRNICALRNAVVHNKIDGAEIEVDLVFLEEIVEFIKSFDPIETNLVKYNGFFKKRISDLRQRNLHSIELNEESFCKGKIKEHIKILNEVYNEIIQKCTKFAQTPFFILSNLNVELRDTAAELLCKISEYHSRSPQLFSQKKFFSIFREIKDFRNRQYHEIDERASPGVIEYIVTPNLDDDVWKLLKKVSRISLEKQSSTDIAFFSNSCVSSSSSSATAKSSSCLCQR